MSSLPPGDYVLVAIARFPRDAELAGRPAPQTAEVWFTVRPGGGTDATQQDPGTGGAAEPFTAQFAAEPYEHDGASPSTLELHLNEHVALRYETVRDDRLEVSGRQVTAA